MQAGALTPEAALANAALVPDPLVLHAAAYKALAAQARGGLRTRSLHAELVFNLSGSKHVRRGLALLRGGAGLATVWSDGAPAWIPRVQLLPPPPPP